MAMIRKQVYIKESQDEELKLLASELGVTESEILRRGIDLVRQETQASETRKSGARLVELMKQRAAKYPEGGGTGKVSRDDIYYERLYRHINR